MRLQNFVALPTFGRLLHSRLFLAYNCLGAVAQDVPEPSGMLSTNEAWNVSWVLSADYCCSWGMLRPACWTDPQEDLEDGRPCPSSFLLASFVLHELADNSIACQKVYQQRTTSTAYDLSLMYKNAHLVKIVDDVYNTQGDLGVDKLGLSEGKKHVAGDLVASVVRKYQDLDRQKDPYRFVEVGVHRGEFAQAVLSRSTAKHARQKFAYTGVDRWSTQERYDDPVALEHEAGHAENLMLTIKRLQPFWSHVDALLKLPSLRAAALFEDGTLDFVFLDARHDYCSVKEDIAAWWPKVRRGGMLAGHDYHFSAICSEKAFEHRCSAEARFGLCPDGRTINGGVAQAVHEFAMKSCFNYITAGFADVWFLIK